MKLVLVVILISILASFGCSQTFVPGRVVWETNYQSILGEPIPANVMVHNIYFSANPDSNFALAGQSQPGDSSYNLVENNPGLYTGTDSLYFYIWNIRTDLGLYGIQPSDTTRGYWFPDGRIPKAQGVPIIYDILIPNN